tara:strand:- start:1918 stop:2220 length:303 start_codon:yes stop_codon:yes gene_type:complete
MFLQRLRKKPEYVRKMILWTIVIIVTLVLLAFWVFNLVGVAEQINQDNLLGRFFHLDVLDEKMEENASRKEALREHGVKEVQERMKVLDSRWNNNVELNF